MAKYEMKEPKRGIWLAYICIKILYMFFALFVWTKFTSLGDTFRYISGGGDAVEMYANESPFTSSSKFLDSIAHPLSLIMGPVLVNVPFALLSVYGVYYPLRRLNLDRGQLTRVLIVLSLPSFGIWTSVVSKEAVSVFFMGIILGQIIDLIERRKLEDFTLTLMAIYLCILFKPQYMAGILSIISYILISRLLNLRVTGKAILIIVSIAASIAVLYVLKDLINGLSYSIPLNFDLEANGTRQNTMWLSDNDIFWNAPYGIYLSLVGPTITEAMNSLNYFLVWLESMFILMLFLFGITRIAIAIVETGKINIYIIGTFLTGLAWILFVMYPLGVLNPGSAVRYREGIFGFYTIIFYYIYHKIVNTANASRYINR
jgi:hypothetical protein